LNYLIIGIFYILCLYHFFQILKNLELSDNELFAILQVTFLHILILICKLWSYNIENDVAISLLNDNLIIKFRDYITNEPFYTFLGTNAVENTVDSLLTLMWRFKHDEKLQLIPEKNILNNKKLESIYLVDEDRNNFDYIYSLEKMRR